MTREHQLQEMHVHKEGYVSPATRRRIHHLSPLVAPSELLKKFPPCGMMASELDPLLDDSIMFTRRLHKLGKQADVRIKVAPLLPHGWLNMYFTGDPGSMAASAEVLCWMKQMLNNGLAQKDTAAGAGSQTAPAAVNAAEPMSATDALVSFERIYTHSLSLSHTLALSLLSHPLGVPCARSPVGKRRNDTGRSGEVSFSHGR